MQNKSAPTTSGYAPVNGLQLYYEVYGSSQPVVLLHGSFMNIELNWADAIPLLSPDRQVIVAEMQGHGCTRDVARTVSYEAMADDVAGLLTHLHVQQADVVGYSMGGGIAFQLAVRHPQWVRRLVVLSAPYTHDGWWPDAEASFADANADMFKDTPILDRYVRLGNDPAHFAEFVKKVISIDSQPYDWSAVVFRIEAPLFLAFGDADGLPHSRLAMLPGTTHVGMLKRLHWLVPMITDFLDADLDAPPPTF